jgi:hypothetical protein
MPDPSETTQVSRPPDGADAELLSAVRTLAAQVGGLQAELRAIRTQIRSLPAAEADAPGWNERVPPRQERSIWVHSLDSPVARRPPIPRLLLEVVFLVGVAVLAAVAQLDAIVVGALMAGAWILVALAEWAAAMAARRRDELAYGFYAGGALGLAEDPSWFGPPVERTVLEVVEGGDDTAARLPPPRSD